MARAAIPLQLRGPVLWKSWWQIANTFIPFFAVCAFMHFAVGTGHWEALLLIPLAAGFLVRIFIIQHDCGHGAFFRSARANDWLGRICGVLTLTPYDYWRRQHRGHHTRWNCLDRRGADIDTYSKCLTVAEYRALSPPRRWLYRLQRNTAVMFFLIPPIVFLVVYRIPFAAPREKRRARLSVHLTSAAIGLVVGGLVVSAGGASALLVQLPINMLGAIAGAWLFFVQHQFERTTWVRKSEWQFGDAVANSSSFLNLPPVLRWFSGNIGYHHIHHLDYRIPNYHLAGCQTGFAACVTPREVSLWGALKATQLALWDEAKGTLVRFCDLPAIRPA